VREMLDFEEGWSKMITDLRRPKTFDTIGERKKFTIHYVDSKIVFLSHAYEGCIIFKPELRKVYERFIEKRSWKTTHYNDSRHASYFLRLLKEYFFKEKYTE